MRARVHHVEHHIAHLSSAFMVSPYEEAAVVSVDGFGDFVGAMWGVGNGNRIEVKERIYFPPPSSCLALFLKYSMDFCSNPSACSAKFAV